MTMDSRCEATTHSRIASKIRSTMRNCVLERRRRQANLFSLLNKASRIIIEYRKLDFIVVVDCVVV